MGLFFQEHSFLYFCCGGGWILLGSSGNSCGFVPTGRVCHMRCVPCRFALCPSPSCSVPGSLTRWAASWAPLPFGAPLGLTSGEPWWEERRSCVWDWAAWGWARRWIPSSLQGSLFSRTLSPGPGIQHLSCHYPLGGNSLQLLLHYAYWFLYILPPPCK